MKKNLLLVLSLSAIILLTGCKQAEPVDESNQPLDQDEVTTNVDDEQIDQDHPEWTKTSLTTDDLKHIEETLPPLSYVYETYDMKAQSIVNSGSYEVAEWENPVFSIPEYSSMVDREVTNSWIEDDMIYTLATITLDDGSSLDVLYVNEPDTLFCRAIEVINGGQTTLYSNFVYAADVE